MIYSQTTKKTYEKTANESTEIIRMLEAAQGDSLEYAHALFSFSKYCRELGLFDHSLVTAGTSSLILEKYKKNASTFHEKYSRCVDLINVNNFIKEMTCGRSKELYGVAMMPEMTSMIASVEIVTECLDLTLKAIEIGDSATVEKMNEYINGVPQNAILQSTILWQDDDIEGALKEVVDALNNDTLNRIPIEEKNLLQQRKKALTLLQNASKKNIAVCVQIADSMYYPITLSQLLYDQRLPDYYLMLKHIAQLYQQYKAPQQALAIYEKIEFLLIQLMRDDCPYLLPTEKRCLWGFMQPYFDEMQQFACKYHTIPGSGKFLYNITLLKKELFETTPIEFIRNLTQTKDEGIDLLMAKRDSLIHDENTYKTSLAKDYISAFKNAVQIVNLERIIVAHLKKANDKPSQWHYQWEDVVSQLSPQEAVVEFINLQRPGMWSLDSDYWAIVFKGGDTSPQLISLFPASELSGYYYGDDAYKKIWKPIEKEIKGCSEVYVASEGYLKGFSLAGIKVGESFLCDQYDIHNLMSTKDLISIKSNPESCVPAPQRDIIFFGGAEFGLPFSEITENNRGQGFAYLPGTVKEINEICQLLPLDKWRIHKYMGRSATEKAFKKLSSKPFSSGILHVSTHGFNLSYDKSISNHAIHTNGKSGLYEPLLRTGFALTGANETWTCEHPMDGTDDGIVTAFEIGDLNLKNIEMVVLSTCKSGLGEIREGEGLLGMSKAFRMAGVRYILVTLDNISDKYMADFMIHFYDLLQKTGNVFQAFIQTQREMKNIESNDYLNKWADFKLIE